MITESNGSLDVYTCRQLAADRIIQSLYLFLPGIFIILYTVRLVILSGNVILSCSLVPLAYKLLAFRASSKILIANQTADVNDLRPATAHSRRFQYLSLLRMQGGLVE